MILITLITFYLHNSETRLVGAVVRVGPSSNMNNPVCGTVTLEQINAGQKIDFTCNVRGQYLSIHNPSEALHLCEVQAFIGDCGGKTTCFPGRFWIKGGCAHFIIRNFDFQLIDLDGC